MFDFMKKKTNAPRVKVRNFKAAQFNRTSQFVFGWQRINQQLATDAPRMILRARDLAQNSDNVAGFLNMMQRNIVGDSGFRLQCRARGTDGVSDSAVNATIEALWDDYQNSTACYIDRAATMGGRAFDVLVMRTLLTDGEVFIRRHHEPNSRFGWRYEVLDALDVDYLYNQAPTARDGYRVRMGIKLDAAWHPVSYFIRKNETDVAYQSGERIEVPADEIIHIFRKQYAYQVRGITPLAPAVLSLNQLESYKEAELVAARMQACSMAFYEKTGNGGGDMLDEEDGDDAGDFTGEMSPGQILVAPDGYHVNQISALHPNQNFSGFVKSICRGVFNSLGISYNKGASDFESVNYSSLREAALEDRSTWRELQAFIIEEWKDRQFDAFLRHIVAFGGQLDPVRFDDYRKHRFYGRAWDWVDPAKDIAAIESAIALGLTDHITEIEKRGGDVEEVLDREALYLRKRAERGLPAATCADIKNDVSNKEVNDNAEC